MRKKNIVFILIIQSLLFSLTIKAQTTISPLVGEAIRAFRNNEFETAREKADKAILSGNYSMNQRRDLYYIRGYGLFLASNYTEALKDFDMVLDIKMTDKQSQLLKAECYYYMNKFDRGVEEFNLAEKTWKSTDDNYNNMAAYIKSMRGKCQYKQGKYEVALNELNRALALDSTVMDIWETFGDVNFTLKNFDTAISYYSKAIELYNKNNDNSIYSWIARGQVYDTINKLDDAIYNFKQAIKIKSFEREPYWLTAKSYEKKKVVDSSLIYFQEALARTDSEDVESLKLLNWEIGFMYKKNDKFDDAISYFQKALKIDDHYKEAYAEMADCYVENKQYTQSIEPYERAIFVYQQDKKDSLILSSLYLKLGDVYNKTKNQAKAKDNFLSALKWNKGNNSASMNQANVLFANKKYKEALPFFKKVIDNPIASEPVVLQEAYYKQGMCYLDNKDTGQAIASFQKSMEFKTTHDEAQVKLSEIYYAKKQFDKLGGLLTSLDSSAKKFDTTALAEMYYKKGVSDLTSGNAAEAKNDFTKCINFNGNIKKAYHGLGDATMQTKEYALAEDAYTHCIELYKNEKDSLYKMLLYRANAKSKQNNFTDAVDDIETANKMKPGNVNITKSLIETNIAAGSFEKAEGLIVLFQKSLKTTDLTNIATCYYYKAQCNVGLGNTDNALADLAKAMSYNRNYTEAQKLLNSLNGNGTPESKPAAASTKEGNNTDGGGSVPVVAAIVPKPTVALPKVGKGAKETKKSTVKTSSKKGKKGPIVTSEEDPKKDSTVVSSAEPTPVVEPKKDTVIAAPTPVVEAKKDTVVTPPAVVTPKIETTIVETKKDTFIAAPAPVVEVKKDTVVTPKIETPVVETKKDTIVASPTPVVEAKKDTVVTPPAVITPKVETPVVEVKKDTVVTPPAPVIPKVETPEVEVKKDTVVTPPTPVIPKVEAPVVEVKKDTVVVPPTPVTPKEETPVVEVKKDTAVTPPAPVTPKVETPVIEPKKDTIVASPTPVVEAKKDTVVTPPTAVIPKVEPIKKDTATVPSSPVTPKVDSAKTEVPKDSSLPKEIKKEGDHLQSEDRSEDENGSSNNNNPLKEEANKEYYKERE